MRFLLNSSAYISLRKPFALIALMSWMLVLTWPVNAALRECRATLSLNLNGSKYAIGVWIAEGRNDASDWVGSLDKTFARNQAGIVLAECIKEAFANSNERPNTLRWCRETFYFDCGGTVYPCLRNETTNANNFARVYQSTSNPTKDILQQKLCGVVRNGTIRNSDRKSIEFRLNEQRECRRFFAPTANTRDGFGELYIDGRLWGAVTNYHPTGSLKCEGGKPIWAKVPRIERKTPKKYKLPNPILPRPFKSN